MGTGSTWSLLPYPVWLLYLPGYISGGKIPKFRQLWVMLLTDMVTKSAVAAIFLGPSSAALGPVALRAHTLTEDGGNA